MTRRLLALTVVLSALAVFGTPRAVGASCGCEKPAPVAAAIRPNFAFPARDVFTPCNLTRGGCVALFDSQLVQGHVYEVEFRSARGERKKVKAVGRLARDLADGSWRTQLWPPVPPKMPIGPTAIEVRDTTSSGHTVMSVPATDFTVIAPPIVFPEDGGVVQVDRFRGAVGADGTLYVAIDVSGMLPRVDFVAKGINMALRFNKDDMVIYNTQGVIMEELSTTVMDEDLNNDGDSDDQEETDWNGNGRLDNPDISTVMPDSGPDSDTFFYTRHEFERYDTDHQPGEPHGLDGIDLNWHADGTRHTDNFHFVAAISRATINGMPLTPGATDPFALVTYAIVDVPSANTAANPMP